MQPRITKQQHTPEHCSYVINSQLIATFVALRRMRAALRSVLITDVHIAGNRIDCQTTFVALCPLKCILFLSE